MKIRKSFVSNSSSSSFIIFNFDDFKRKATEQEKDRFLIDNKLYIKDDMFTCERYPSKMEDLRSFSDKIMYVYHQINDSSDNVRKVFLKNFKECLAEYFEIPKKNIVIVKNKIDGWVDHQSSVTEGVNMSILFNKDIMFNFLFNEKTFLYIDMDG